MGAGRHHREVCFQRCYFTSAGSGANAGVEPATFGFETDALSS